MTMLDEKGSGLIWMNIYNLPRRQTFLKENLYSVYGTITAV